MACTVNQSKDIHLEIVWKNWPCNFVARQKNTKTHKNAKIQQGSQILKNAIKYARIICFLLDYLNESNIFHVEGLKVVFSE